MVKSSQRPQSPRSVVTRAVVSVSSSPVLTPPAPKPLEPGKALADYQSAVYESQSWSSLVPKPITDLTLSGARMSVDDAWLEVGGREVRVYGGTGQIHWFKNPVPSEGAWMTAFLPGMQAGATYVGQIRCFASPIPAHQYHIALKLVHPDRIELSYIPVGKSSFIVPFAFISVAAPGSTTPCVQFFPEYLSHCVVYDVRLTKV